MQKQIQPKERPTFAEVKWAAEDIKTLRPRWSLARCEEFLASIEKNLEGLMTERGWAAIEDELCGRK